MEYGALGGLGWLVVALAIWPLSRDGSDRFDVVNHAYVQKVDLVFERVTNDQLIVEQL